MNYFSGYPGTSVVGTQANEMFQNERKFGLTQTAATFNVEDPKHCKETK